MVSRYSGAALGLVNSLSTVHHSEAMFFRRSKAFSIAIKRPGDVLKRHRFTGALGRGSVCAEGRRSSTRLREAGAAPASTTAALKGGHVFAHC